MMKPVAAASFVAIFVGTSCGGHLSIPTPCCDSSFFHPGTPPGWTYLPSPNQRNDAGVFDRGAHGGRYAAALVTWDTTSIGAGLMQVVTADRYRGKRIRVSAWLKETANTNRENVLWIRIATPSDDVGFTSSPLDNVSTSRENAFGISPWQQRQVVIDVPVDATAIAFGVLIVGGPFDDERGPGPHELFVDDFQLDIVGASTSLLAERSGLIDEFIRRVNLNAPAATLANLDFEKRQ